MPTWRESELFSAMERDALEYAERMTITGQKVTDELLARLRGHFSEAQIVELTAAVALENFRSKFNVPLGVEAQGFCVLRRRPDKPRRLRDILTGTMFAPRERTRAMTSEAAHPVRPDTPGGARLLAVSCGPSLRS